MYILNGEPRHLLHLEKVKQLRILRGFPGSDSVFMVDVLRAASSECPGTEMQRCQFRVPGTGRNAARFIYASSSLMQGRQQHQLLNKKMENLGPSDQTGHYALGFGLQERRPALCAVRGSGRALFLFIITAIPALTHSTSLRSPQPFVRGPFRGRSPYLNRAIENGQEVLPRDESTGGCYGEVEPEGAMCYRRQLYN
ncbi:hypothetical protein NDU88_000677 [Pleurodeles waltl]|uniref:Uncharacterized protein n=1 Tax=Pleurodeles waltl TaxID=8319 RepID=A0AAV7LY64_PLEWA|nr:hypothetical protein NDU88_000677 [Pleurodeles waltl]